MNVPERSWKPAAIALALAVLVMVAAPALAACGSSGSTASNAPSATTVEATPTTTPAAHEIRGWLGDPIVLCDGGNGQLEVTALRRRFFRRIATRDSTASNVYGVKLKLRNVGSTPLHLVAVAANSILSDGAFPYRRLGDNPKNALTEVDLGLPGESRVGWVYFEAYAGGGPTYAFRYTVKSSDASAEVDTGQWKWKPGSCQPGRTL